MPNVIIPTDHPDAGNPLLLAAARVLVAMGARVQISESGENLVRRIDPRTCDVGDNATALVAAEGLPNLLHELVHAVQAGFLGDDYGIDYSAIPFDLGTTAGRAVLWDELACCTISCAYLTSAAAASTADFASSDACADIEPWFREQIEIQPVFYGMEDHPRRFVAEVARRLDAHADEADEHLARAYMKTEDALREAGASPDLARPPMRLHPRSLWSCLHEHPTAAQ